LLTSFFLHEIKTTIENEIIKSLFMAAINHENKKSIIADALYGQKNLLINHAGCLFMVSILSVAALMINVCAAVLINN